MPISWRRGSPCGSMRDEELEPAVGEGEPEPGAEEADDEALEEELAGDAAAAGAEGGADRELLLPPLGAHEEEVRDVGAGDEQDEADARP